MVVWRLGLSHWVRVCVWKWGAWVFACAAAGVEVWKNDGFYVLLCFLFLLGVVYFLLFFFLFFPFCHSRGEDDGGSVLKCAIMINQWEAGDGNSPRFWMELPWLPLVGEVSSFFIYLLFIFFVCFLCVFFFFNQINSGENAVRIFCIRNLELLQRIFGIASLN